MIPSLKQMLAQLVAARSISSNHPKIDLSNREVIDLLAEWCAELGMQIKIQPINSRESKFNLIARLGPDQPDKGIIFSGHTDTVPCDPERWQSDPFTLTERDNRYYGLGCVDMKGFFAILLDTLAKTNLKQLKAPLYIVATADEECSMDGARALMADDLRASIAIIGEPTGMVPIYAHKGIMMESIKILGQAGHSSNPAHGANALDGMSRVLNELINWRSELMQEYQQPQFLVPYPTLNLGHIQGGDNPNRICGSCELHFDLRPLPGMEVDLLRSEIQRKVERAIQGEGLQCEITPLFQGTPPLGSRKDSPFVVELEALCGEAATTAAFATEAPYFQQLGIEAIVMGPGDITRAHQPDEFMDRRYIEPYQEVLQSLFKHHLF